MRGKLPSWLTSICLLLSGGASLSYGQSQAKSQPVRREVAVTFDDLPGVAMPPGRRCDPQALAEMNRKLLRAVAAHRIPALGLVVEGRLCEGHRGALPGLLGMWLDAGLGLGNHSFSHLDLNNTPLAVYTSDVIRGESVTRRLLEQRGMRLKYFRHPLLHAGKDLATKRAFEKFLAGRGYTVAPVTIDNRAFEKFLAGRGYTVAPVTIDNQEWVFAEVYAAAVGRGDRATAERVGSVYVSYMEEVFDFFEGWSVEVAGYEIKQVLLLHASPLNADYLDELALMMKRRGYAFVSLEEALQDPAYRLPDDYAGPRGLSWLHRWALTKGMPLREEPREPEFIARLHRNPAGSGGRRRR